jgi:perosamine synthetase
MDNLDELCFEFVNFAKRIFNEDYVPLHRPVFNGNELYYLSQCIESNFVSSVGQMVLDFEKSICDFTRSKHAVATSSGTAALHSALLGLDVQPEDEVITQAATFVATANAIDYCNAHPVFVDVDLDTMSLSPSALESFLIKNAYLTRDGTCVNKLTHRVIKACVMMHTFGLPGRAAEIKTICDNWNIRLLEDAAESLGSYLSGIHTGLVGHIGVFSFNGNKIITTGGGGAIVTDDQFLAQRIRHLTTTARVQDGFLFKHDEVGFNYRMPNINAALGCAQMERLFEFIAQKTELAKMWQSFFQRYDIELVQAIDRGKHNNWFNTIILKNRSLRDEFLTRTNNEGVMTRPMWELMCNLPMYKRCQNDGLRNSKWLNDRVVNIPSSAFK